MKTHTVKGAEIKERWYVVDAANKPLGRLASDVASVLRGKHRPEYSPHLSLGDHVVVINADRVHVSGRKREQKVYYSYSGYQGGLRIRTFEEEMTKDSARVIRHAVKGMLPKNSLGRSLLSNLRVYAGSEHPHVAQQPDALPDRTQ